nr:hypothetical protein CFP56_25814 [Quercus suber]
MRGTSVWLQYMSTMNIGWHVRRQAAPQPSIRPHMPPVFSLVSDGGLICRTTALATGHNRLEPVDMEQPWHDEVPVEVA